jgi:transporter family-2 protein
MRMLYLCLAFIAGGATSLQVPVNAALRTNLAHPMQATFVSFTVGLVASLICCLVTGSPLPSAENLSRVPWWAWFGGVLGMLYVGSSIVISPKIGVAPMLSMVIAGQMVMSLLIDHFGLLHAPLFPTTPFRLVGAILVAVGAALMTIGK